MSIVERKDFVVIETNGFDKASPSDTDGKTFIVYRRYGDLGYRRMFRIIDGRVMQPMPDGVVAEFKGPPHYVDAIEAWLRGEDVGADILPKHRL